MLHFVKTLGIVAARGNSLVANDAKRHISLKGDLTIFAAGPQFAVSDSYNLPNGAEIIDMVENMICSDAGKV